MWRAAALAQRFDELSDWLARTRHWWQPRAFFSPTLPWERDHPALATQLRALPLAQSEQIAASNTGLLQFFAAADCDSLAEAAGAFGEIEIGAIPSRPASTFFEARDVPGRKWQQILAFAQALPHTHLSATEWCAGKAHLGRHYAHLAGAPVDALEWSRDLVAAGNALALRERVPVNCHHVDVLTPPAAAYLRGERQVLALHACGQLHLHLLHECARERPASIALAPCCYQLQPADRYAPLSQRAQQVDFVLDRLDLKTAVQESVTSSARVQKQRRQLQAWRLAFDVLQRDMRGINEYLPTPPLPPTALQWGFETFCRELASAKALSLPPDIDFPSYQQRGEWRLREVAALDLPRMLFRRPLELWLVLDRALFLQQHGYDVAVGTFCERALTPRNLLILAQR